MLTNKKIKRWESFNENTETKWEVPKHVPIKFFKELISPQKQMLADLIENKSGSNLHEDFIFTVNFFDEVISETTKKEFYKTLSKYKTIEDLIKALERIIYNNYVNNKLRYMGYESRYDYNFIDDRVGQN